MVDTAATLQNTKMRAKRGADDHVGQKKSAGGGGDVFGRRLGCLAIDNGGGGRKTEPDGLFAAYRTLIGQTLTIAAVAWWYAGSWAKFIKLADATHVKMVSESAMGSRRRRLRREEEKRKKFEKSL